MICFTYTYKEKTKTKNVSYINMTDIIIDIHSMIYKWDAMSVGTHSGLSKFREKVLIFTRPNNLTKSKVYEQ